MTQQPMQPIRATSEGLSQEIVLSCLDPWGRAVDVPTTLSYRADDPYAVALVFHSATADVQWVVSRTLLLQGLAAPSGDGDVRAYPSIDEDGSAVAILDFCSPDGQLTARADSRALQAFLARTFEMVPLGTEGKRLDMDGLIAAILRAA
jgi:hypothetical protein